MSARNAGDGKIEISVTDHGIGISPSRLTEILTVNRQISTRGTAGETGSGLGLVVSREMLALAGSRLSATSKEGVGSTFSFTVNQAESRDD